jgi:methylated-DNA-[protein]-cysteine S-methyltransferase
MTSTSLIDTPLGDVVLRGDEHGLTGLAFAADGPLPIRRGEPRLAAAADQVREYFAGQRTTFDLPLRLEGTDFDRAVWAAVAQIGYGETATYGELAARIGHPGAARAVGAANGRNPIALIVPCHRVIGAGGALTGYAYGVERKRALLELEARREPLRAA